MGKIRKGTGLESKKQRTMYKPWLDPGPGDKCVWSIFENNQRRFPLYWLFNDALGYLFTLFCLPSCAQKVQGHPQWFSIKLVWGNQEEGLRMWYHLVSGYWGHQGNPKKVLRGLLGDAWQGLVHKGILGLNWSSHTRPVPYLLYGLPQVFLKCDRDMGVHRRMEVKIRRRWDDSCVLLGVLPHIKQQHC